MLTILDLCGGTGSWSAPYAAAGYDVRIIDLKSGEDVRLYEPPALVHGILAAPPCTVFASSGARWERSDDDMREALSIVDACIRLIFMTRPIWWALENPIGILRRYIGPYEMRFDPCDYGDPYTKKTCLWGNFTPPPKKFTTPERVCSQGSWLQTLGGKSERTKELRSMTPPGFARAFFESNP